jgi:hypothetical protein
MSLVSEETNVPEAERNFMRIVLALVILTACAVAVPGAAYSAPNKSHGGRVAAADPPLPPLPPLKRQHGAAAVVAEHLAALNVCDWNRLMAQYPPSAHIFLPGGTVVIGREAIGQLFLGFCKSRAEGGNKGLVFTPQQTFKVGNTLNVQWSAAADFLTGPYLGADAYVTKHGLMYAMVSTFGGGPGLPYTP